MAYIMAMVVFGAIMHIMGPEKNFCTIPVCGAKKEVEQDEKKWIELKGVFNNDNK